MIQKFYLILTSLFVLGLSLVSCVNNTQQASDNDDEMIRRASIIAQDFVKERFSSDCHFKDMSYRGEGTMVENRYVVYQKFTSRKEGQKNEYIYKIFIQYFGGEWTNTNNWAWSQITIENTITKQQFVYNDNGIEKRMSANTSKSSSIDNLDIKLVNQNGDNLSLSTPAELSKEQIKMVIDSYRSKYSHISFYTDKKVGTGETYVELIGENIFDFRGGSENGIHRLSEW